MSKPESPPEKPQGRRKKTLPEHRSIPIVQRCIRRLLGERQISLMELDRLSGMAPRYSSQVINGHVRLTFLHLFRWLDALEVSPVEFFAELSEMMKPKHKIIEIQPPDPDELDELVSQVAAELLRRGGRVRVRQRKAKAPGDPASPERTAEEQEAGSTT